MARMNTQPRPIEALARGLAVLEALSRSRGCLTNGQLSRATSLAPSTVSRMTDSLVRLGYVRMDPQSGGYELTPKILRFGYPVLTRISILGRAQRALDELTAQTGMTSMLAIPDGQDVAVVNTALGRQIGSVPLSVGGRFPMGLSAAGIALLAATDEPAKARLVREVRESLGLHGKSVDEFDKQLQRCEETDTAVLYGAWRDGIGGIASAVHSGGQIYAISVIFRSRPSHSGEPTTKDLPIEEVLQAAHALSD